MIFNPICTGGGRGIKLASIAITTAPTKTAYNAGENFDTTGMVVTATYSNGATLAVVDYTVNPQIITMGTASVTITYTEGGVSKTATQSVTVTKNKVPIPTASGTLTYNGSSQSPTINNEPSTAIATRGGDADGTNAGDYTKTYTLVDTVNYEWATTWDGNLAWSIGKKTGTLTASKSTITLNASKLTDTFTIGGEHDGTVSVQSSDATVATVSKSDNTVTVTSQNDKSGTVTVSVSVSGTSNYTVPADATVTVTAVFRPAAYTSPQAGVTYTNGLSGLTDAQISEIAEAISNNSSITNETNEIWVDTYNRHVSIGDQISYTMSDTSYAFRVMGFNHYALTSSTAYGSATATGKAGILMQMVDSFSATQRMKSSMTSSDGWHNSNLRTWMNDTMLGYLPSATQSAIKQVNIFTAQDVSEATLNTTADKLFLPAEVEIFGSTPYAKGGTNEGIRYAWYKANDTAANRVKKVGGSAYQWWERSPYYWSSSNSRSYFCRVNNGGDNNSYYANSSGGVAPCFNF